MAALETTTLGAALLAAGAPDAPALIGTHETLTFAALRDRVRDRERELALGPRGVVVLQASNTTEFVVTYLALLEAGHVPLLAGHHVERLAAAWRPVAVIATSASGIDVDRRTAETRSLHPHLRLLLTTSGSTGAPKLVRLSDRNLVSNARAIGSFLGLTPADRGITSLPLHYCYGLSVLHSHLVAGAGVVVTPGSVVDACVTAAMADHGVTNLAGVPHTFDLLERAGPERIAAAPLRFVTVAGGRMPPERVGAWSRRCRDWGAELYVMYGQTEATARMAYLPPALASRRPAAIGIPIPGGELELQPVEGLPAGVGELVYRGDNVMMGYARHDHDLAAGAELRELRTGDLARYHADDGVYEIVGRRSRLVKPFGLRIDLDALEQELAATHPDVAVAGDDHGIAVHAPAADAAAVLRDVTAITRLPPALVTVAVDGPPPRTDSGKVDYDAIASRARPSGPAAVPPAPAGDRGGRVAAIYAAVLGRGGVAPHDTFVSLGGDSMNYVECSIRLEQSLGRLPPDWHVLPVARLEQLRTAAGRTGRIDSTVVLRAVAIAAVVATHMHLSHVPGGAHILLAVVGYNLSRFQLPIEPAAARIRAGLRTVLRAAVPAVGWIAAGMALFGAYSAGTLALVNNYVGPPGHRDDHWHFWFVEVFVHLGLITTLLLAARPVRRIERRFPYAFPCALLVGALVLRMEWAWMGDWYNLRYRTHGVAWFFVLGWLAHRSTTPGRRLLTSAAAAASIVGFFHYPQREWFILAAVVVLVWWPELPWPRWASRPVAVLAGASMWILITHFSVWPLLLARLPMAVAYPLTLAAGVAVWVAVEHGVRVVRRAGAGRSDHAVDMPARPVPSRDDGRFGMVSA